jgi:hypothetical protein
LNRLIYRLAEFFLKEQRKFLCLNIFLDKEPISFIYDQNAGAELARIGKKLL